jgi:hypothetical protein
MSFRRREHTVREYVPLFLIVAEGTVTERKYFSFLARVLSGFCVDVTAKDNLKPDRMIAAVEQKLRDSSRPGRCEAWIVTDRDAWAEADLREIEKWAQSGSGRGFAISNPAFEYWLLLHFDDGKDIGGLDECRRRLKRHVPKFNGVLPENYITRERVEDAMRRARRRWEDLGGEYLARPGLTSVHRLVERMVFMSTQNRSPSTTTTPTSLPVI